MDMFTVRDENIYYRLVTEACELREIVELQNLVWGPDPVTSMQQMSAAILHGGSVIGAISGDRLVGFCYGFIGYDGKEPYVGSHMMGIHPDYRNLGIGMRLKLEQRLWALQSGYGKIVWTFDPFESRNGYLNICKLGGTVSAYIPEFYGIDASGFPTDRFLVEWSLNSDHVIRAINGQSKLVEHASVYPRMLPVQYADEKVIEMGESDSPFLLGKSNGLRLPIPRAAAKLKQLQPEIYKVWQRQVRELATASFASGYQVVSCQQSDPDIQDYVLEIKR
ncbi:putative GNAT superfamily acetyltransferase [Paenibacillus endophyticus]|uniref:Putative GNAT superfamily acetyltransferase n=1 Tax=Paenibacillus endophyticus TaxID=1294268 RepID=A0A7W5CEL7_9BACL|nr:GNAT family N-acetyltransferase [Paenibacillus endophyticus]MBB3155834.1 putative GNAT superfamily acetyltransferase [Paenibacillus endophyticus]